MDACSSLLEAMNRVWAVPGSSPPPYQEDLLMLEWDVVDIQTAVGEAEAREMDEEPVRRWLMEVKEACSVAKNRLREFQIKSPEPKFEDRNYTAAEIEEAVVTTTTNACSVASTSSVSNATPLMFWNWDETSTTRYPKDKMKEEPFSGSTLSVAGPKFRNWDDTNTNWDDTMEAWKKLPVKEESLTKPRAKASTPYKKWGSVKQKFKFKKITRVWRGLIGRLKKDPKTSLKRGDVVDSWIRETIWRFHELTMMGRALGLDLDLDLGSQIGSPVVYGTDDDRKKVIELLLSGYREEGNVSVVGISAADGMGKTTLCHLVYNDPEVRKFFEIRAWVSCVSENFDLKALLIKIIESLTGISCFLTETCEVEEALKEELIDKRFLLVLDDVCNMGQTFWNDLLAPLGAGANGSVVIVTAKTMLPYYMTELMENYRLGCLSHYNCWLICQNLAFDVRARDHNPKLIASTKRILSKCKGVPLSAKALGGFLRCRGSWWNVVSDIGPLIDDDEWHSPTSILLLCYNYLPEHLKRCFVYCSLFPKGYIFERDHLVRLWLSQGFILPEYGKTAEDIGTQYFDQLLSMSLFQYSPIYDATEGKFEMHGLFYHLFLTISLPGVKCFRTEDYRLCTIPEKINHTSFVSVSGEFETAITFEPLEESKDLLTFLLVNRSIQKWDASLFRFENTAILDDLFLKFRSLRTLDLSNSNIMELPCSVENLKHLCYLALNNTNIKRLPESICSLHSLQTLELQHCNRLIELPKDTKNLSNLRHLHVWKEAGFVSMPAGIGQLTSLQTLSTFHVGEDELQCGIRELKDLVGLRGDLCIGGLESVISEWDAVFANLDNKRYLRTLTLQWLDIGWDLDGNRRAAAACYVLLCLQPHSGLQELVIRDYYGKHFPRWMGETSFSQLISITLDNCYGCQVLPPLGQLPSLKCLSIRKMDGVRFVGREFCGSDAAGKAGFPSLETLKLWEMYEWEEWDEVNDGDFPRLRSLTISRCPKLRRLPCFTSLLELSVHCCTNLPGIPTLESLESLKIEGFQNLKSLALPSNLPALKKLEINYCNQLSSVVGIGHLSSVEQLKIIKCPKLQLLTNEQIPLMLQVVHIHCGCTLLREWCPYGFEEEVGTQVIRKLVRNTQ